MIDLRPVRDAYAAKAQPYVELVEGGWPDDADGFTKAADTTSVLNGFPRVLMRLDLG